MRGAGRGKCRRCAGTHTRVPSHGAHGARVQEEDASVSAQVFGAACSLPSCLQPGTDSLVVSIGHLFLGGLDAVRVC